MTDLVKREQPTAAVAAMSTDQLKFIANTDFIPKSMRGNLPAILACVATGRALGLADMDALRSIHIIDGKATMSAELMVKLARRNGHSISGQFGDGEVTVVGRRADTGDEMTVTWTTAMAQRANLVGKDNWKKYPEAMLWARAASQLCRMLFPDCLGGVSYTPEEAELSPEERVAESLSTVVPQTDGPDDEMPQLEPAAEVEPEGDQEIIEPEPEPLTQRQLAARVKTIDKQLVNDVAREMFPGSQPADLSDDDRGRLFVAIQARTEFSFADLIPEDAR